MSTFSVISSTRRGCKECSKNTRSVVVRWEPCEDYTVGEPALRKNTELYKNGDECKVVNGVMVGSTLKHCRTMGESGGQRGRGCIERV